MRSVRNAAVVRLLVSSSRTRRLVRRAELYSFGLRTIGSFLDAKSMAQEGMSVVSKCFDDAKQCHILAVRRTVKVASIKTFARESSYLGTMVVSRGLIFL